MSVRAKNTLNLNDLALAQFACGHAADWWKKQGKSAYCRAERAKYEALGAKLSALSDRAALRERYVDDERVRYFDNDLSSAPVMRLDFKAIGKLHARARRSVP